MKKDKEGACRASLAKVAEYYSLLGLVARIYILPAVALCVFVLGMAWLGNAALTPYVKDVKTVQALNTLWIAVSTIVFAVPAGIFLFGIARNDGTGK